MNSSFAYGENTTIAKTTGVSASVENAYHSPGQNAGDISALEWKNGTGTLPGSDLKFRRNERGDIEVVMDGMNGVAENGDNQTVFAALPDDGNNGQVEDLSRKTREIHEGRFPMSRWNDAETIAPARGSNGEYFVESPLQQNQHGFMNGGDNQFQSMAEYNNRMIGYGPPPPLLPNDQLKPEANRLDPFNGRSDPIPQPPQFQWDKYLQEQNAVAAPESVFREMTGRDPFPPPIRFVVGDLLESVDPLHQSLICAVSVVEVKGCRMRLHFDGYSTLHDFWMNANDDLIFPCGFCEKTGRKLHPPKESDPSKFHWENYARATGKTISREDKFREDFKKCYEKNSKFNIGEKLEAIDRQNPELTCVATVTDIIDKYILIHFDGWNHNFDYWCDHTSNSIHPVGWCGKAGQSLAVPHDYLEVDSFSWSDYLEDTNSKAAAEEAFQPRKSHGFEVGSKLEVVDKRNPILVRVATIADKDSYRVKIRFDGWEELYDYWIDCDSTDLHPIKWSARTGHSLQPNITEEERQSWQGGCPVPGCRGLGHIKGSKFLGHHSEYGCPYSSKNLDSYPIQDRITPRRGPKPSSLMSRRIMSVTDKPSTTDVDRKRSAGLRRTSKTSFPGLDGKDRSRSESRSPVDSPLGDDEPPEKQRALETKVEVSGGGKNLYYSLYSSSLWSSVPNKQLAVYWEQCTRLIQGFKGIRASQVCKWSVKEVAHFVENLTGKEKYGEMFLNEEIDGEAFLLLTQNDIFKVMRIKLGPTLKIHGAILYARANE